MGQDFEVLARILVRVRTRQDGDELSVRRKRDGANDLGATGERGVHDLLHRFVDDAVVKGLELDFNGAGHGQRANKLVISLPCYLVRNATLFSTR